MSRGKNDKFHETTDNFRKNYQSIFNKEKELKKLFIDKSKAKTFLNNATFNEEKQYSAYTADSNGRELFVSIKEIEKLSPETAAKLLAQGKETE